MGHRPQEAGFDTNKNHSATRLISDLGQGYANFELISFMWTSFDAPPNTGKRKSNPFYAKYKYD